MQIPSIFLPEFAQILGFLDERGFAIDFKSQIKFRHFMPLFVDKKWRICPFGGSEQALIIENDEEIFSRAEAFLRRKFGDEILCLRPKNASEIKKIKQKFRYCLILGEFDEIYAQLNEQESELTLF